MRILENLYYSTEHEWVRVEGEKAYIGITDYAQHHLGDIVFVELPELEAEVEAGTEMGVIESVKAVSEMFSPVGGTIVVINEALEESPELLNEDSYENFIAVVEMNNLEDLGTLLNPEQYEALCAKEEQEGK
ncbi:MAG: glycine cleavage system protein GcvH [Bacillota bacterium]|nr:glycine cleavage system protein GcvH [Bacillota bacterium]